MQLRVRTESNILTSKVSGDDVIRHILGQIVGFSTEVSGKVGRKVYIMDTDMKLGYDIGFGLLDLMLYKGFRIILEK